MSTVKWVKHLQFYACVCSGARLKWRGDGVACREVVTITEALYLANQK